MTPGNKIDRTQSKDLQKVLALLETLQEAMDFSATLEQARIFVTFCMYEGLTGVEYRPIMGVPQSSLSRALLNLGDYNRSKQPGFGLIDAKIEVDDLRSRRYTLTLKGRKTLHKLQQVLHA